MEVTKLIDEARHEMIVYDRPSKRTSERLIAALTTAKAEAEALRAEVERCKGFVGQIIEAAEDDSDHALRAVIDEVKVEMTLAALNANGLNLKGPQP